MQKEIRNVEYPISKKYFYKNTTMDKNRIIYTLLLFVNQSGIYWYLLVHSLKDSKSSKFVFQCEDWYQCRTFAMNVEEFYEQNELFEVQIEIPGITGEMAVAYEEQFKILNKLYAKVFLISNKLEDNHLFFCKEKDGPFCLILIAQSPPKGRLITFRLNIQRHRWMGYRPSYF